MNSLSAALPVTWSTTPSKKLEAIELAALAIGLVVATLGLVVIVGWLASSPALVQIRPTFAPMQFNTALCFLATGASLCCVWRERFAAAFVAGASAAAIGAVWSVSLLPLWLDFAAVC